MMRILFSLSNRYWRNSMALLFREEWQPVLRRASASQQSVLKKNLKAKREGGVARISPASACMQMQPFQQKRGINWKTSSQTTYKQGQTGWRSATITFAVHPWHGENVTVLQSYGDRAVVVERENGDRRIIPVSWTSLVPLVSCRVSDGRTIRITPQAAIELSRWVSIKLDSKHGGKA